MRTRIVLAVVAFFIVLWGGAYLNFLVPDHVWYGFPTFFTTIVLLVGIPFWILVPKE
jgi:hypothetical protein